MALTRKSLKAMGLTDEQIDSVIDMHSETVDALKAQIKTAEEKATDYDSIKAQLDALKSGDGNNYKDLYETERKAFEDYKNGIAEKDACRMEHLISAETLEQMKNYVGREVAV